MLGIVFHGATVTVDAKVRYECVLRAEMCDAEAEGERSL